MAVQTVTVLLIAGAQLQSHLVERSSVTVRKEAQGFLGAADANWVDTYTDLDSKELIHF